MAILWLGHEPKEVDTKKLDSIKTKAQTIRDVVAFISLIVLGVLACFALYAC